MLKKILYKIKMLNNFINNTEYLKGLQVNSYYNSIINNIIDDIYLPRTIMSLKPYAISHLLNEILLNNRTNIIEFGSGISTILIAKLALKNKLDLKVVSIDEESEWTDKVRKILRDNNLENIVKLLYAPITTINTKSGNDKWYDTKKIEIECCKEKFDMIIIDGPKAFEKGKSEIRYHALNFLQNKLQDKFVIFLDDANRAGEKEILKKWKSEYNLNFEIRNNLATAYKGKFLFTYPV